MGQLNCVILQVAKCKFLNETVVPNEQANQLGITVELYEKLVIVRKLYTDKTNSGRLAQAVRNDIFFLQIFVVESII